MRRSTRIAIAAAILLAPPAMFAGNMQIIRMERQRKAQEAADLQRVVDQIRPLAPHARIVVRSDSDYPAYIEATMPIGGSFSRRDIASLRYDPDTGAGKATFHVPFERGIEVHKMSLVDFTRQTERRALRILAEPHSSDLERPGPADHPQLP